MKNSKNTAILLFILAFTLIILQIWGLNGRHDHEQNAVLHEANQAVFSFNQPAEVSLFICTPENQTSQLLLHQPIHDVHQPTQPLAVLAMNEPRKLEIPEEFASAHQLNTHLMCTTSPMFRIHPNTTSRTWTKPQSQLTPESLPGMIHIEGIHAISIPAPKGALVVAATSTGNYPALEVFLFLAIFTSLAGGCLFSAKAWWQASQRPKILTKLRFYDAPIAFIAAMFVSALFAGISAQFITASSSKLLPSFGEMIIVLGSGFVAFLLVTAYYLIAAHDKKQNNNTSNYSDNLTSTANQLTHNDSNNELDSTSTTNTEFNSTQNTTLESQTSHTESSEPQNAETSIPHITWKERITRLFLRPDSPKPFPMWMPFAGAIVLTAFALSTVIFAPIPGLTIIEMATMLTSTCFLSSIFAILAGFSEECFFRGIVQTSLEARPHTKNPALINALAILITTALFVLVHVPQSLDHLWALVPIGCVSLTVGWIKLHYRSIFPAILVHMTYNGILLLPSVLI